MNDPSDKELVNALYQKFEEKEKALYDLKMLNKALDDTNQRLLESERVKSSFLSTLKNELNNPMSSILGLCEELMTIEKNGKLKDIANSLLYEALSLEFQLNNILAAAEFESGEFLIDMVKTDINSIIESVIDSFAAMAEAKKIKVRKRLDHPIRINSDPEKIRIIISNLMSNAIIFNIDGGAITIEAEILEEVFFLSIKDTGVGVPVEKQKIIFDRFVQLDKGVTKKFRGHGLGLSVAKAAANFLNGDIAVTSNEVTGTCFTLMIPANFETKASNKYSDGVEFFEFAGEEKEL